MKLKLNNPVLQQNWIAAFSQIQDSRFVLYGTHQLDVCGISCWYSHWDTHIVGLIASHHPTLLRNASNLQTLSKQSAQDEHMIKEFDPLQSFKSTGRFK